MLPKHALLMAAILSISTPAALALDSANVAIIKPAGLELKIKPEQQARINSSVEDLNLKIKNAFKGEEALQNEMQAELEKIVKMTDESTKRAAVSAYQNKYKGRYQAILAKGQVSLTDFAARLNGSVPEVEFTVTPNMLIKAKSRIRKSVSTNDVFEISEDALQSVAVLKENIKKANESQTATAQTQSQPTNTSETIRLNMRNFSDDTSTGCGLVGNAAHTRDDFIIKLTGTTIAAGQCDSTNERKIRFEIPKRTRATVTVTANLKCSGFAAAVGLSISQAVSKANIIGDDDSCEARPFATLLMTGYEDDPVSNISHTYRINNTSRQDRTIEQRIASNYLHLISMGTGGATGESKISNLTVSVKFESL